MIRRWDECLRELKQFFVIYFVMQMQTLNPKPIVIDFAKLISNVISITYVIMKF